MSLALNFHRHHLNIPPPAPQLKHVSCTMRWVPQLEDVAIALSIFIFIFTIPAIRSLFKGNWRVKSPNRDQALYEDEDGAASGDLVELFSNRLQFIIAFAIALIGLGLSIVDVVFATIQKNPSTASFSPLVGIYLLFPCWVRSGLPKRSVMLHAD
jgi:hypothetical protein